MPSALKQKIYLLLDPADGGTGLDKIINGFIVGLILLNTGAVILETVASVYRRYELVFKYIEWFSVAVFSLEFVLRVWTCTCIKKYSNPVTGRLRYIFSRGSMIDLLAILPFYLPLMLGMDLRFVRILRLLRFFRFFKLGRYLNASIVIGNVFKSKKGGARAQFCDHDVFDCCGIQRDVLCRA